jgi:hypothetical protein
MEFGTALQLIETVVIVVGAGLALVQLYAYQRGREREVALELLHSYQTPEFSNGLVVLFQLPDGLSKREIDERLGNDIRYLVGLFMTLESLGVLVHRGDLSLEIVDDFFSGAIVVCWRKCRRYVEELRAEQDRETLSEWMQWLAERMQEREGGRAPEPAYVTHRGWKPSRR